MTEVVWHGAIEASVGNVELRHTECRSAVTIAGSHIAIVEARDYPEIADELVNGALRVLEGHSCTNKRFEVPSAFNVPAAIRMILRSMDFSLDRRRFDGYIGLGCLVRDETGQNDLFADEIAGALQGLARRFSVALGCGIVISDTTEQALKRAGVDQKNEGAEAARTVLAMIALNRLCGGVAP